MKNKLRKVLRWVLIAIVAFLFVVNPIATVIIYESIFNVSFQTAEWLENEVSEFKGLEVKDCFFYSGKLRLAGYEYSKGDTPAKGVVVLSHGYGGGGHNGYMPIIDALTSNGYLVFAYDARANDYSAGRAVGGLPTGIIDLDSAITFVKGHESYKDLPIVLLGHSWGAYSAGSVLALHSDVKAAVLIAGFNESEDMIYKQSKRYVAGFAGTLIPYVSLYEGIKFGRKYSSASVVKGIASTTAGVLVVHSQDDESVPPAHGYDKFYREYYKDSRVRFKLYKDKGHSYVMYSDAAAEYRNQLNDDYVKYVEQNGLEFNEQTKSRFMLTHLNKKLCFEPNAELVQEIVALYDEYCVK